MASGVKKHVILPVEEDEFGWILVEEEEPQLKPLKPCVSLIETALDEVAMRAAKPKSAARKSGEPRFSFERGIVVMPPVRPSKIVLDVQAKKPQPRGTVLKPKPLVKNPPIAIAKPSQSAKRVKVKPSQKPGMNM